MQKLQDLEVWFVTGSQHLYGAEALTRVAENSQKIVSSLTQKVRFHSGSCSNLS